MRDRARANAEGKGKSMGFGFVSFTDHQHALAALRHTNNNPEVFGDKKVIISLYRLYSLFLRAKKKYHYISWSVYQKKGYGFVITIFGLLYIQNLSWYETYII